jgi:hypothetical protein
MPKPSSDGRHRGGPGEKGVGMRATARAGVVLLLAAGTCLTVPVAAHADSATPVAVKTNWYWSLAAPSVEGNALPVAPPADASTVPAGDLGVGYVNDQEGTADKVAAIAFDLGAIPIGSVFSSFRVTVPYDANAHQLTTGTPEVSACELLDAFLDAPGPSAMTAVPPSSLPSCVKGVFSAKAGTAGGYVFDLTSVANDWSGGAPANGILLRPSPGLATAQQPFSISLQGKNGITTAAEYTPAPPVVATEQPVPLPGPVVAPPPVPGYVSPPVLPGTVVPAPSVAPVPQANPLPTTAAAAALPYHQGTLVPSGVWWLALLALLGLLGLTAVVLGDPLAPAAPDPRRRRFADVVRAHARPAAVAVAPAPRRAPRVHPA